jgi:LPS sulfotransferase NodH
VPRHGRAPRCRQGLRGYADQWGIARSADGGFRYADYLREALAAGRTGNGVFAARIMWETLDELVTALRTLHPDVPGGGVSLLRHAFGRVRFVYLRREDVVAQAASLLRAEQTNVWHDPVQETKPEPDREAEFDFDQHNAAWRQWFSSAGVEPFPVRYDELATDPAGTARRVLDFLELAVPSGRELAVGHRRLADELSTQWITRYQAELPRC